MKVYSTNTTEMDLSEQVDSEFISLINHNPDLISRIDRYGTITFVNDSLCAFSGYSRAYYLGKGVSEIIGGGPGQVVFLKKIKETFDTGVSVQYQAQSFSNPDVFFEYEIIPLESKEGEVQHVLCIQKDITQSKIDELQLKNTIRELQVLSDQLVYQNKLFKDFAYITSHNLRSPVANLTALLQIYDFNSDEEQKQFIVEKLKVTVGHLSKTIQELTDTVSVRGQVRTEQEIIRFQKQLDEVIQSVYSDVDKANAIIVPDFSQAEFLTYPKIYLESIFLNLLTNSIKYRAPDRQLYITVETRLSPEGLVMIWKDNGLGIDMEKHGSRLFGLKNTFHDHGDARGIGLYITRNQIESLGGTIIAKSKANEGCEFNIVFKQ